MYDYGGMNIQFEVYFKGPFFKLSKEYVFVGFIKFKVAYQLNSLLFDLYLNFRNILQTHFVCSYILSTKKRFCKKSISYLRLQIIIGKNNFLYYCTSIM